MKKHSILPALVLALACAVPCLDAAEKPPATVRGKQRNQAAPGATSLQVPLTTQSRKKVDRAMAFSRWDTNKDGVRTFGEYQAGLKGQKNLQARFKRFDKNGDDKLTREEFVGPSVKLQLIQEPCPPPSH